MSRPAEPTTSVLVLPDRRLLVETVAARLVLAVLDAQAERGWAEVGLTGGGTGGEVVAALVASPLVGAVDWSRVDLWWGDERYLLTGHPDRNDTQADEAGLGRLGAPAPQIHRVAGPDRSTSVQAAAQAYGEELHVRGRGAFDVLLLGVGGDGHVASLFPGHPAQRTPGIGAVAVTDAPKDPPTRVTLTAATLSRARELWFVVAGEDKAGAVAEGIALAPPERSSTGLVRGHDATRWLLDAAAASRLAT